MQSFSWTLLLWYYVVGKVGRLYYYNILLMWKLSRGLTSLSKKNKKKTSYQHTETSPLVKNPFRHFCHTKELKSCPLPFVHHLLWLLYSCVFIYVDQMAKPTVIFFLNSFVKPVLLHWSVIVCAHYFIFNSIPTKSGFAHRLFGWLYYYIWNWKANK